MGYKKQMAKVLFPLMANWDWSSKEEYKKDWKKFRSNMDKMWDQFQDLQKASKDTARKQWEKVFPRFMEMQQTVADALPDKKVSLPGMPAAPVSPKEFVEKAKELQEKINRHAIEAGDRTFESVVRQQQHVKEVVSKAVDNVEEKLDEKED